MTNFDNPNHMGQSKPAKRQGTARVQGSNTRYPNRRNNTQVRNPNNQNNNDRPQQRRNQTAENYNKYMNMAKDAMASSDSIAAETWYQHAEHYYRTMNASTEPK